MDGLTGVGNYRALMDRLRYESSRHHRRDREFALLTLDLDSFKGVNESLGHLIGDAVLATVGSMLDLEVRAEDSVFRQGGDEFAVIAPETGAKQAAQLADRIRENLKRVTIGPFRLSASVGAAIYPQDATDASALLEAADASLRSEKLNSGGPPFRRFSQRRAQEGPPRTRDVS